MLQYGTALIFELHHQKEAGIGRRKRTSEGRKGRWNEKRRREERQRWRTIRSQEEDEWTEEESEEDEEEKESEERETYSPDELLVKIFLMEGIEKQAAVVRELKISGCSTGSGGGDEGGGGGRGSGGGCSLSKLTNMFQDIAVWSQSELMEICNGASCVRGHLFFYIFFALFLCFLLLPTMN